MLLKVNNRRLKKKYLADINDKQSMDDLIQIYNTKKDGHYDFLRPPVCKKKLLPLMLMSAQDTRTRYTEVRQRIQQVEHFMSKSPLHISFNIQEAHSTYISHSQYRKDMNKFYFSKT